MPSGRTRASCPTRELAARRTLELGAGTTLRVLHTPGHACNHLCYLLEEEKLLFTGDHLMQGTTVVINPPDGDMAAYLPALRRLLDEDLDWLAPGHGFLIDRPHAVVRDDRAPAAARGQGAGGAASGGAATSMSCCRWSTPTCRRAAPGGGRSLLAHLLKLGADGGADEADGQWSLRG